MKKNLDNKFREIAEEQQFEYDANAWSEFKELYQEEEENKPPATPVFWKRNLMLALALCLLSSAVTYYFVQRSVISNADTVSKLNNESTEQTTATIKENNKNIETQNRSLLENDGVVKKEKSKTKTSNEKDLATSAKAEKKLTTTTAATKTITTNVLDKKSKNSSVTQQATTFPQLTTDPLPAPVATNSATPIVTVTEEKKSTPVVNSIQSDAIESVSTNKNTLVNNEEEIKTSTVLLSPINTLLLDAQQHEDAKNSACPVDEAKIKGSKRKGQFYALAAAGKGELNSHSYEFGLGKKFQLNNHFALNLETKYRKIIAEELPEHRGYETQYSFVETAFFSNSIAADQLHYLSIPLSVEYQLARHRLNVGIAYNRLVAVKGLLYQNIEGVETSKATWIVETGMNTELWTTSISYGFLLDSTKELFGAAEFFLTDTYNEDAKVRHNSGTVSVSQKLSTLKLGLKYFF